uniref:zinc finger protein 704-like isoform X2 n=1 Tax=Myxine glutinosa TaxID=7769 RepID=UPI00358EECFE
MSCCRRVGSQLPWPSCQVSVPNGCTFAFVGTGVSVDTSDLGSATSLGPLAPRAEDEDLETTGGFITDVGQDPIRPVSSNIDVPRNRDSGMDDVAAAMVLTSLSTSPANVLRPPSSPTLDNVPCRGSWPDVPACNGDNGWRRNTQKDCWSPPTPPSPLTGGSTTPPIPDTLCSANNTTMNPLTLMDSTDCDVLHEPITKGDAPPPNGLVVLGASCRAQKGLLMLNGSSALAESGKALPSTHPILPNFSGCTMEQSIEGKDTNGALVEEPSPRKRKNSLKLMFKCMWPNCDKVLSTASGMQRHIRTFHLGRNSDSDLSDGEEDFYYTEIEVNVDSVTDGLSSLAPVSPTTVTFPGLPTRRHAGVCRSHSLAGRRSAPPPLLLSRSAPTAFWNSVQSDHAYQASPQNSVPLSPSPPSSDDHCSYPLMQCQPITTTPSRVRVFSVPDARIQGASGKPLGGTAAVSRSLSTGRRSRGDAKKCRKVYGMENKDLWCTACRWKKACQRFND